MEEEKRIGLSAIFYDFYLVDPTGDSDTGCWPMVDTSPMWYWASNKY